jgi:hypothetical protein
MRIALVDVGQAIQRLQTKLKLTLLGLRRVCENQQPKRHQPPRERQAD